MLFFPVCSICIRKYMLYKTSCPACFIETVETQLRNNRALDEVVGILERLKDPLCQALNANIPNNVSDKNPHSIPATSCTYNTMPPEICDTKIPSPSSSSFDTSNITLFDDEEVSTSPTKPLPVKSPILSHKSLSVLPKPAPKLKSSTLQKSTIHKSLLAVSTSKSASFVPGVLSTQTVPEKAPPRTVAQMLMSPVKKAGPSSSSVSPSPQHSKQSAAGPTVNCPMCNVDIPQKNIHLHVEACIKNSEQPPVARLGY